MAPAQPPPGPGCIWALGTLLGAEHPRDPPAPVLGDGADLSMFIPVARAKRATLQASCPVQLSKAQPAPVCAGHTRPPGTGMLPAQHDKILAGRDSRSGFSIPWAELPHPAPALVLPSDMWPPSLRTMPGCRCFVNQST